ncbi:MAG: efflux RND transporter periplasmic adaptor subunit [Proteobacteria bacterium]|nr:efflux RND transporter periplasmic adaptor subunit [Pseudomonadota bacterium]
MKYLIRPVYSATRAIRAKKIIQLLGLTITFFCAPLMATEKAVLDCLVKPEMYVELSSSVDAILDKMLVDTGDQIKKGQPLVKLERSVEIARVHLARMRANSDSEIDNRRVQLQYAKRNYKRIKNLYARKSVSLYEKDKVETEVALAEIELDKATEKKKMAQLNLELALAELERRTIRSPIDGIVVDRYSMVGESVVDRTIMKLAQVDPLRVELIAPTEYFGLIKKGMEVDVYPERPANKSFKATVTIVDQLIDPASGSFTIRMALPNPGDQLVGGVNCIASFSFNTPVPLGQNTFSSLSPG